MTADMLRAYLERLRPLQEFATRSRQAQALGLSRRTLLNYLSGRHPVPGPVARLVGVLAAAAAEDFFDGDRPRGLPADSGTRSHTGG